jgi:uncharacterized protein YciI
MIGPARSHRPQHIAHFEKEYTENGMVVKAMGPKTPEKRLHT